MLVERRQSAIHGSGVFARASIEKGHWQYIYGEVLPLMEHPMGHYCFEHDGGIYLPYAPFCWTNSSKRPNCEFDWDEEMQIYIIIAARDIETEEELTFDYGYDL